MEWFGKTWDAGINEGRRAPTPVNQVCGYHDCGYLILDGDRGVQLPMHLKDDDDPGDFYAYLYEGQYRIAFHIDCFLHSVLGAKFPEGMEAPERHP